MYDLIIIGGGPAGLAAASYALGKRRNFLLIYAQLGGSAGARQSLVGPPAPEYLAGAEAVRQLGQLLSAQAGHVLNDQVDRVEHMDGSFQVATAQHGVYTSTTLIVATGAAAQQLDVPGARALLGQGLGYSATTHAPLLGGRAAAVVGASARALRGAFELAHAAAQVFLIIPDQTPLAAPMRSAVAHLPNVEVLIGYQVREVVGPMHLTELVLVRDHDERRLRVDAAFIALGLVPNSAIVSQIVHTNSAGFIQVDQHNATSLPGLFAAGDVTSTQVEQVLIAIGDGTRAAMSAHDYLLQRKPGPGVA